MNLREGFRRVYVIFAVCVCAGAGVALLSGIPTAWKLAEAHRNDIARADVGPVAAAQYSFDPFLYVFENYGSDLPASLNRICMHRGNNYPLVASCARYQLARDSLLTDQVKEALKSLGILWVVAMALYWVWRTLDWVFAGFSAAQRRS